MHRGLIRPLMVWQCQWSQDRQHFFARIPVSCEPYHDWAGILKHCFWPRHSSHGETDFSTCSRLRILGLEEPWIVLGYVWCVFIAIYTRERLTWRRSIFFGILARSGMTQEAQAAVWSPERPKLIFPLFIPRTWLAKSHPCWRLRFRSRSHQSLDNSIHFPTSIIWVHNPRLGATTRPISVLPRTWQVRLNMPIALTDGPK
jgi:hypothetical protein